MQGRAGRGHCAGSRELSAKKEKQVSWSGSGQLGISAGSAGSAGQLVSWSAGAASAPIIRDQQLEQDTL